MLNLLVDVPYNATVDKTGLGCLIKVDSSFLVSSPRWQEHWLAD
jgi:hypothetical protein